MLFALASGAAISTAFEAFIAGVGTAITAYSICKTGKKIK